MVFGSRFSGGSSLIPFILAWIPSTETSSLVSGNFLSATNRQSTEAKIAVFAGGLGVALTVTFISFWGAVGAAMATLLASVVHLWIRSWFVQHNIGRINVTAAFVKPLVCAGALYAGIRIGMNTHSWLISATMGVVFYAAAFAVTKPYDKYDHRLLASALKKS
jgi:O-antigen/teichoic acid export membrane protein